MRKTIYAAIIAMAATFTACDDYLTVQSPDQVTSESYWRTKTDVENAMSTIYSKLYLATYGYDRWSFAEVKWPVEAFREDIIKTGNDVKNYPQWMDLYNFSYTKGNSQFSNYWWSYYRGISYANQVMGKVKEMGDKLADEDRDIYLGETRFMRAYYHMQLLLNWERIILRDKYITSGESSVLDKAPSERPATWDFIIEDFEQAAKLLPEKWDKTRTGRATAGAAYAYLGWACLTKAAEENNNEFYQKAVDAFNQVKGYKLVKDFVSMFNGEYSNSPESIFAIQFTLDDSNGAGYATQMHKWIACAEFKGWDEILPSKILVDEYKKEGKISKSGDYDARFYATLFTKCDYFNDGEGKVLGYDYDEWFNGKDRPVFRKFLPVEDAYWEQYTDVDVPLMRYANVLLMKAEALNKLGKTAEAISLINEVRKVHGNMPAMTGTTAQEVQDQIEHERMLEFPLENLRWYDLRRWNKIDQAMKAAGRRNYNGQKFYPIPEWETTSNPLADK